MSMIKFIKQAQALDDKGLELLRDALVHKKSQLKWMMPEWADTSAQLEVVNKLRWERWKAIAAQWQQSLADKETGTSTNP